MYFGFLISDQYKVSVMKKLESQNNLIYFDNAATTFPKPETVIEAVVECMRMYGANPGRSGHWLSVKASDIVFKTRLALANLFGVSNPMHVVFESNATSALNLAIKGLLSGKGHVMTTSIEHNSTIRPLHRFEKDGVIILDILEGDSRGVVSVSEFKKAKKNNSKLVVINHMSNVTGVVQPIREIGKWCRENNIISIVDCSQSAGVIDIDLKKDFIDIVAFTGHKGLYGPMGIGGLVLSDSFDYRMIKPLKEGGTGSLSDEINHPCFLPDIFESGTLNVPGIAGLLKGIEYVTEFREEIETKKRELSRYFIAKALKKVEGIKIYSGMDSLGVISFTIKGLSPSHITNILSENYNIMSRQGLHCSPLSHRKIGTFPEGTVRFSFGVFNTTKEIDIAIKCLNKLVKEKSKNGV
ncbi:MAG: cysteine desulfurase [Sulfurovum sp.]|nr:MAG: cysteine desulfurase [Sulfurovum sp.]